jgi:hypothetical protein
MALHACHSSGTHLGGCVLSAVLVFGARSVVGCLQMASWCRAKYARRPPCRSSPPAPTPRSAHVLIDVLTGELSTKCSGPSNKSRPQKKWLNCGTVTHATWVPLGPYRCGYCEPTFRISDQGQYPSGFQRRQTDFCDQSISFGGLGAG